MRFLYLIAILFPFVLFSQDNSKSVFTLKPTLGLNGCQIHGDNYSGYDKLGLFGGVALGPEKNLSFLNENAYNVPLIQLFVNK